VNQRLKTAYDDLAGRVPGLGDVDRAIAIARRRRIRRAIAAPTAAALAAAAVTVITVAAPWSDHDPGPATGPQNPTVNADACPVGEERQVIPGLAKSVVLGCAQLPDGRKVALLNAHRSRGLCLQIVGLDNRARECGNAPSAIVPPITRTIWFQTPAQRNESAPIEVFGATTADVATVELRYTRDGSSHETRPAFIRVTDSDVLEQVGIAEPFGYFIAELPADTTRAAATALDADGQRLGTDDFTPIPWSGWSRSMITGLVDWNGSNG
jgi:hypothetical protein